MQYLIAIFLPPVAVAMAGKVIQALINAVIWIGSIILTITIIGSGAGFVGYVVCAVHALFITHSHKQDERTDKIIAAIKNGEAPKADRGPGGMAPD